MATVAELRNMLKELPDDAVVEVVSVTNNGYNHVASFTNLTIEEVEYNEGVDRFQSDTLEVMDLRNNRLVRNPESKKVFVRFGMIE